MISFAQRSGRYLTFKFKRTFKRIEPRRVPVERRVGISEENSRTRGSFAIKR